MSLNAAWVRPRGAVYRRELITDVLDGREEGTGDFFGEALKAFKEAKLHEISKSKSKDSNGKMTKETQTALISSLNESIDEIKYAFQSVKDKIEAHKAIYRGKKGYWVFVKPDAKKTAVRCLE